MVKVGDFGMSRYATALLAGANGGGERGSQLERTLTPGVIGTGVVWSWGGKG